jgi:exodeoxyribonuclease V gamma subunit
VPIGALLDAVDQTVRCLDGRRPRGQVLWHHPLQPFNASNFAVADERPPFSFDVAALRGARAASRERTEPAAVYPRDPLPSPEPSSQVALSDLVRFFAHPVKALLRERGGLPIWEPDDPITDELPVTLEGLQSWGVGDRLLTQLLHGAEPERLAGAEWRRGTLPPRALGATALDAVLRQASEVVERTRPWLVGEPDSRDVALAIGDRLLTGTVGPLHGDTLVTVSYSNLAPKHRLAAFTRLLALTAAHPGLKWQAVTVGRRGTSVLGPVDPGWAALVLDDQLDLYQTGLREPLPFSPRASHEYARLRFRDLRVDPGESAAQDWEWDRDAAYERFFGVGVTLTDLAKIPSRTEEERGTLAETTRFGTLARRVFQPLLSVEQLR